MNDDNNKSWVTRLSNALLREPQTQQQLIELLQDANENKLIDNNTLSIILAVLGYSELHARDVMIPRGQMVMVDADMTAGLALDIVAQSSHSRFPIIDHSRDLVIGVLLAKDLLPILASDSSDSVLIESLARPVQMVPESKRLDNLLKDFQKNRSHMALVVNEYGDISGLVTIEDVLEQIVGDIVDETDIETNQPNIQELTGSENEYQIQALTPIAEINARFDTNFADEDHDTFGGLVIKEFGYLPADSETIFINPFNIAIVSANNRRLKKLKVTYQPRPDDNTEIH